MTERRRWRRAARWLVATACATALLGGGIRLRGNNHLVHIEEVMAGANGNSKIQFIIVEQGAVGQNRWGPQSGETQSRAQLSFFDGAGRETGTFKFPSDPPTGDTLDVLLATEAFAGLDGAPMPDVIVPPLLIPHSGKVCFEANPANTAFPFSDCLSYGAFSGDTEDAGAPAPALPIVGTVSLRRAVNTGQNADFSLVTPNPHNIAGASLTIPVDTLVDQGAALFNNETFLGNGRTCATCHPSQRSFRLTPAEVQSRFARVAATFDPLFIAEDAPSAFDAGFDFNLNTLVVTGTTPSDTDAPCTGELRGAITAGAAAARVVARVSPTTYLVHGGGNPPLTGTVTDDVCSATVSGVSTGDLGTMPMGGLESPRRMRTSLGGAFPQGRALVLEHLDGFANPPVFRKSPHLLNLSRTAPFGLSGEFADTKLFATGAVRQHFTRTLARDAGGTSPDFRLPTADELAVIEAYLLAQEFPPGDDPKKFDLGRFVTTAAQQRGRTAFFGSAKCAQCHGGAVLAATTVAIQGKPIGVNAAFDTGVVDLPINRVDIDDLPCEPSVGACGTREFSTPQLFNVKNLAPFFHDASAATLVAAVEFYNAPAFNDSPAGVAIGGISMTGGTLSDIVAFLDGLVVGAPFTDNPLVAGVTVIKAVHFVELRNRIDTQLLRFLQPAHAYTRVVVAGATILGQDVTEIYDAANTALVAAGEPAIAVPAITPGVTTVIASHISTLRAAVLTLEAL